LGDLPSPTKSRLTVIRLRTTTCGNTRGKQRGIASLLSGYSAASAASTLQGQRSLTRFSDEHLGQVLVVPAAAAAFHDEAVSAWMLFQ
jgi:hypothetical protein